MLIEQCGLVVVHFVEDGSHKRFANKPTAVSDTVFVAKTIQDSLFVFVEQDGYSMFAGLLFQ